MLHALVTICQYDGWKFGPMWQSYVEIKEYSVIYFNRVAAFKAVYHRTSVKGEAHMHFVDRLDICMILLLMKFSDMAFQTQQCDQNT